MSISPPLISVVMYSFNNGHYVDASIKSVLDQSYPTCELIIADAGSTDNTLCCLNKLKTVYGDRLRWVSESGLSQAYAINQVLKLTTASIIGWINAGDLYAKRSLSVAYLYFKTHPKSFMFYGGGEYIDLQGNIMGLYPTLAPPESEQAFQKGCFICQPSVFVRRHIFDNVGFLNENLNNAFDIELWTRLFKEFPKQIGFMNEVLAYKRIQINESYDVKVQYDYVVPIGSFCSPAYELKRLGYRSASLPFDWVFCQLHGVAKLIESNFEDLFNLSYLERDINNPNIVRHIVYKFIFVHDFDIERSIEEQIGDVKAKYNRRIARFYNILNSNKRILFFRYSDDLDSNADYEYFVNVMQKYTINFGIYVLSNLNNRARSFSCEKIIFQDFVVKDADDSVCRYFFNSSAVVKNFEARIGYSDQQRKSNLSFKK